MRQLKNTQCQQYLTTINGTLYYFLNFFCKFHFSLLPPVSLMLSNCSPIPGNIVWREKRAFKFLFFRWIIWFLLIGGLSDTDWGRGGNPEACELLFPLIITDVAFTFFTSFSLKAWLTDTCIVHNRYSRLACASI